MLRSAALFLQIQPFYHSFIVFWMYCMYKEIVFGLAVSVCFVGSASAADGGIVRIISGTDGFLDSAQLCAAKQYQDFFLIHTLHLSMNYVWSFVLQNRKHRPQGSIDAYRSYKERFQHERRKLLDVLGSSRHKLTRTDVMLLELYTTHIFMWGFMCALVDGYDASSRIRDEQTFNNFSYYCELVWNTLQENQKQDADFTCRLREKEKVELGLDHLAEWNRWQAEIVPACKLVAYEYKHPTVIGKKTPKKTSCITIEYDLAG
ncbi:MAG: hypothetical protein QG632_701 [Candidatus Dependentiae bacterium]|nr:hypothetical protein [Candidatus Dependentiae bacterium]